MRKLISIKFVLSSALLALALVGDHSLQNSNAQTQPAANPIATSPDNASAASALPPDIDPNSPLAQVIRLVQAGVDQSVILTYISNSTSLFNLSSDDIIYLNDLGAPTEVINAMMQRDQQLEQMGVATGNQPTQPAVTAEPAVTQPAGVTVNYFYDTLAPYGAWVNLEGYGWCWQPTVVIYNAGWQPYCNNGYWVYSDQGWYWISGYSWGWATFHYGRWFHNPRYGWCWWPNTTWAPSWACWRYNQNYCGWAPLPPYAVYQSGVGLVYQGHAVSVGFNFGLSASAFTFVPTKDFCSRQPWRYRINAREVPHIYNQTTVINNIAFDSRHQGIVNAGIPPHDITAVTRQEIHPVAIRAESGSLARGGRHEQFESDGRALIVNRPHFVGSPVLSLHQGAAPAVEPRQNENHPTVHGSENSVYPHSGNPAQNNFQHSQINQTPNLSFNHVAPQASQARQLEVPHSAAAYPQEHNNVFTAPSRSDSTSPFRDQTPSYNYGSDNRMLSPRVRGNTTVQQPSSSPPAVNHYSPPTVYPQYNYRPPSNESQHNDQHFNHSESRLQPVQPHSSHQSFSSSSQQSSRQRQD